MSNYTCQRFMPLCLGSRGLPKGRQRIGNGGAVQVFLWTSLPVPVVSLEIDEMVSRLS